jgi:ubiquinone/menaquinone biosynthesis C-methylase UbiE
LEVPELDPQQSSIATEFDSYRDSYEEAVNRSISFSGQTVDSFIKAKALDLINLIEANFEEPGKISALDVGCGVGNYHGYLAPLVGSLTGIDVSAACVDRARDLYPDVSYDTYDGARLPYDDDVFDIAFTICVLHHVPLANRVSFLGEIARVLRPGGLCVVYEHSTMHPLTRKAVADCPFDRDAVLVSRGTMRMLFRDAGLGSPDMRSILTLPHWTAAARRLDRWLGGAPFGTQYRAVARAE